MPRQTKPDHTIASIGVVLATIGVLALGLFVMYQIILSGYGNYEQVGLPERSESATSVSTGAAASAEDPEPDPEPDQDEELTREAERIVADMTTEQKVAQLFVVSTANLNDAPSQTYLGDETTEALGYYPVGGIIFFQGNLESESQATALLDDAQRMLTNASGVPGFLCVDEEGGTVARMGGRSGFNLTDPGDAADLGAAGDVDAARDAAKTTGEYLDMLGFNVNFAPDADLSSIPGSIMARRSFGADAATASPMVAAEVEGYLEGGIIPCAKHFPGIGGTSDDTEYEPAVIDSTAAELEEGELLPFESAIDAGVPMIMVGHAAYPAVTGDSSLPACLSEDIVTGILREDLGFDGVVITDSLSMGAVASNYTAAELGVMAIDAGCDMILTPTSFRECYKGVLDAVKAGEISEDRLDESCVRIVRAKLALEK